MTQKLQNLDIKTLEKLYWKEGKTLKQIADNFNVNPEAIRYKMIKHNIPRRKGHKEKYIISKKLLQNLYVYKKLSTRQIAKKLNIKDNKIIFARLIKYNIPRRTISESVTKYPKKTFSGNLKEKAYMLGLRIGDLSASKSYKTINVTCSSTVLTQIEMIKKVFREYCHVYVHMIERRGRKEWFIRCSLDSSFDFLLEKPIKIPEWILNDEVCFYAFLAGYSDAEGCWSVTKDGKNAVRYEFNLGSEDKDILEQIKNKLRESNFEAYINLKARKGTKTNYGVLKEDLYGVVIHKKLQVLSLVAKLILLGRHDEKINRMRFMLENKDKKWSEIEDSVFQLTNQN